MLRFKSMEFQNFGSFEGAHSFNFAQKGVHLITAKNLDLEGDSSYSGKYSVGSGKCLHEDTIINIASDDKKCLEDLKKFLIK